MRWDLHGSDSFFQLIPHMLDSIEIWKIWKSNQHLKIIVVLLKAFLNHLRFVVEHIIILKEATATIEYRCHEKVTWSPTMYIRGVCQSSIHMDGRTQRFRVLTSSVSDYNVTPDRCMSADDVFRAPWTTDWPCMVSSVGYNNMRFLLAGCLLKIHCYRLSAGKLICQDGW